MSDFDELNATRADRDHWFKMWDAARAELAAEREAHALTTAQIAPLMRFKWNDDQMRRMEEERDSLKSAYFAMQKQNDALRAELAAEREKVAAYQAHIVRCDNSLKQYQYERDEARAERDAEREQVARLESQVDKLRAECARRRNTVERLYAERGRK